MATKRKNTTTNSTEETVPAGLLGAVLKYLRSSGFDETAKAFIKDSKIAKDADKDAVDLVKAYSSFQPAVTPANKRAKTETVESDSDSDSDSSSSSSSSSDSSSSSSSESVKKPAVKAVPAKSAAMEESDGDSDSDSSSSSSESEKPAKKSEPVKSIPVKSVPTKKESSSSSSSSSSDSDDSDDESSSSSSSDEEEEAPKAAPVKKTPAKAESEKPKLSTPAVSGNFKIYVKGLPWAAKDHEIKDFFKACEGLQSVDIPLGDDGRSSGTAFVVFSSKAGFDKAIELDGQYWPGTERWLKIIESTEKTPRQSFAPVGERPDGCDTVFVGNLPWDVDEEAMRNVFSSAGEISGVRFAVGEDGSFRGFGHVSFFKAEDTENAVKLAGTAVNGRNIRVDYAPPRNRDSAGSPGRGGGRGTPGGRGGAGGRGGRGGRGAPSPMGMNASGSGKKTTFD